jgi:antiviral helicase SLH1
VFFQYRARAEPTQNKGKGKKGVDLADVIGSMEDIERRMQEQLGREKAMFTEEGLVRSQISAVHRD